MENAAGRKILFDNEEFAAALLNATQAVRREMHLSLRDVSRVSNTLIENHGKRRG
jgi:hypothetical protein